MATKKYTNEQRQHALRLLDEGGRTQREIAKIVGVTEGIVWYWKKTAETLGLKAQIENNTEQTQTQKPTIAMEDIENALQIYIDNNKQNRSDIDTLNKLIDELQIKMNSLQKRNEMLKKLYDDLEVQYGTLYEKYQEYIRTQL